MTPSPRDRISVDLQGLKALLLARAQALGMSPSDLVRETLSVALGHSAGVGDSSPARRPARAAGQRVRLCLRMSREHARQAMEAARRAGMRPGDYVAGLIADVPVLSGGTHRAEYIVALTASSAELSSLSRNVHRLSTLLAHAQVEPARSYRAMLDTMVGDVRGHLALAARVLAELQPRGHGVGSVPRASVRTGRSPCLRN